MKDASLQQAERKYGAQSLSANYGKCHTILFDGSSARVSKKLSKIDNRTGTSRRSNIASKEETMFEQHGDASGCDFLTDANSLLLTGGRAHSLGVRIT